MNTKENLTREYIFKAFIKLLETKTLDEISVCEITEKAGVSRMSFYRNFKSKEDLVYKGVNCIIEKVKNKIKQYSTISVYAITKELFEEAKNYKNIFKSFDNSPISKQIMFTASSKLKENLPVDYMNKTAKYIPIFYFSAVTITMFDWLKNGAEESPEEMARMLSSLINVDCDNIKNQ